MVYTIHITWKLPKNTRISGFLPICEFFLIKLWRYRRTRVSPYTTLIRKFQTYVVQMLRVIVGLFNFLGVFILYCKCATHWSTICDWVPLVIDLLFSVYCQLKLRSTIYCVAPNAVPGESWKWRWRWIYRNDPSSIKVAGERYTRRRDDDNLECRRDYNDAEVSTLRCFDATLWWRRRLPAPQADNSNCGECQ